MWFGAQSSLAVRPHAKCWAVDDEAADWSGRERGHAKPLQTPLLISRGDGMVRACRAQFLAPHLETTVTGATHPSC